MIAATVMFCAVNVMAVPNHANIWGAGGAVTGNWNTAANWEVYTLDVFFGELTPTGTYAVPTSADVAQVWAGLVQVDASVNAAVAGIQTSSGNIQITGGTLNVSGIGGPEGYENLDIARGLGVSGTLTVSGGTLNITGSRFNIGKSGDTVQGVTGVLNQSGGTINAGIVSVGEIAYDDATANGYSAPWPDMAGSGTYNLTGGTLHIPAGSGLTVGKGIDGTMNVTAPAQITGLANILVAAQTNTEGLLNIDGAAMNANYMRISNANTASGAVVLNNAAVTLPDNIMVGNLGTGSLEVSGTTTVSCNRVYVGNGASSTGSFEMSGGTFNANLITVANGAGANADVTISGGKFITANEGYMGQGVGGTSSITVTDTGEFLPKYLRMAWATDSVSSITIMGGGFEADYIQGNTAAANSKAIFSVVGSDPNRVVVRTGRLNFRDMGGAEVRFVLDGGGITPIRVLADHITLDKNTTAFAPTIYIDVTNDFEAEIGDRFTLAQTETAGKTISINGATIVNMVAGAFDFDLEIVNRDEGGQMLQAVVTNVALGCEAQIALGNIMPGDLNQDCFVGLEDLAMMLDSWLICYDPQGCN